MTEASKITGIEAQLAQLNKKQAELRSELQQLKSVGEITGYRYAANWQLGSEGDGITLYVDSFMVRHTSNPLRGLKNDKSHTIWKELDRLATQFDYYVTEELARKAMLRTHALHYKQSKRFVEAYDELLQKESNA